MAWDTKSARRRQNSSATGTPRNFAIHTKPASRATLQAQSAHVADPYLQPFLDPSFDPAEYLNTTLPPLQTTASARSNQGAVSLAELSSQAQSTLSNLNAHTTRLTNSLTQLTDEILRSGSRLAYEVELLRGETLSLIESLTEGLQDDIVNFVPGGIQERPHVKDQAAFGTSDSQQRPISESVPATPATVEGAMAVSSAPAGAPNEPSYITQLRTLTQVRARLDAVIKTFGEAMEFVFPPSELSVSSSFLSVSAPDAGGENHSTEEKGQQVLQTLRDEISAMLNGSEDPVRGIEEAARRIEALKELNKVWKGTAEEKGRTKYIDTLAKMVEDKHRDLLREVEQASKRKEARPDSELASKRPAGDKDVTVTETKGYTGYNLMSQLQKLRSGL